MISIRSSTRMKVEWWYCWVLGLKSCALLTVRLKSEKILNIPKMIQSKFCQMAIRLFFHCNVFSIFSPLWYCCPFGFAHREPHMLFLKINFEIQIWLYKLSANVSTSDMRLDLFRVIHQKNHKNISLAWFQNWKKTFWIYPNLTLSLG